MLQRVQLQGTYKYRILLILAYCTHLVPASVWLYPIEVPHSERQRSPRRIVCLPFAIIVTCDVQVHSVLNILLKSNNADMWLIMTALHYISKSTMQQ